MLGLAALVLAGACGGDDGPSERASDRTTAPSTASTASTTTSAAPGSPGATTAPPAGGGGATSGAGTGTTAPSRAAATTTTAATAPAGQAGGQVLPAPGTYRYDSTGRFTSATLGISQPRDGEVVLTVEPPAGADQRSVRQGAGRTTEQVLRVQGGDVLLVSLRLVDQGITKEVRPSPPALALPAGASPGRTWSWRARSTDGQTEVSSEFRAVRVEDVAVGADRVSALVVEVRLTTTGDLELTSTQTMWVSQRHGLVVRQDDATQGTLGGIAFTSTASDRLRSLLPG